MSMYDLAGWQPVSCTKSDQVRQLCDHVLSSLTDMTGEYGDPIIYTEWGYDDEPFLRDYRDPKARSTCRHYVPLTEGEQ